MSDVKSGKVSLICSILSNNPHPKVLSTLLLYNTITNIAASLFDVDLQNVNSIKTILTQLLL